MDVGRSCIDCRFCKQSEIVIENCSEYKVIHKCVWDFKEVKEFKAKMALIKSPKVPKWGYVTGGDREVTLHTLSGKFNEMYKYFPLNASNFFIDCHVWEPKET